MNSAKTKSLLILRHIILGCSNPKFPDPVDVVAVLPNSVDLVEGVERLACTVAKQDPSDTFLDFGRDILSLAFVDIVNRFAFVDYSSSVAVGGALGEVIVVVDEAIVEGHECCSLGRHVVGTVEVA